MMDCFSIVLGLAFWFSKAYSMSNLCASLNVYANRYASVPHTPRVYSCAVDMC